MNTTKEGKAASNDSIRVEEEAYALKKAQTDDKHALIMGWIIFATAIGTFIFSIVGTFILNFKTLPLLVGMTSLIFGRWSAAAIRLPIEHNPGE